ncbi:hypothetical protein KUTeg_004623 [Tegillarca granosa]|uniref:Uncharacterized protein n=1 Tax=Tegillarca granosa TaxID=220873 RepID=A0ABQ9FKJ6_TEGGR|nr:hypothetical protein KUTeg_004623 [Tegillarca granosa]
MESAQDSTNSLQSQKYDQAEILVDTSQIPLPEAAYPSKDNRVPAHASSDQFTPKFTNSPVCNSSQIASGNQSGYFEPPIQETAIPHGGFFPNTSIPPPPLMPENTGFSLSQQGNFANSTTFSLPSPQTQQTTTPFPENRMGVSGAPCHNPYILANTNMNITSDLAYRNTTNSLHSDLTPISSTETVLPKPVKLNIVDPRFIQNQETMKSGTQNLSRVDSNTNDASSRLLSNSDSSDDQATRLQNYSDNLVSNSQDSNQDSDKDGYGTLSAKENLEGQIVFKSSPVVYQK